MEEDIISISNAYIKGELSDDEVQLKKKEMMRAIISEMESHERFFIVGFFVKKVDNKLMKADTVSVCNLSLEEFGAAGKPMIEVMEQNLRGASEALTKKYGDKR